MMAIQVIKEQISMPDIDKRRYRFTCYRGNINSHWYVYDTMNENIQVGKGKFEDMAFRCLHLNKNFYRIK